MSKPKGLKYYPDFVENDLASRILEYLEALDFTMSGPSGRKVLQFGYAYDYNQRKIGEKISEIPEIINELKSLLPEPESLVQVIINRYLPGEGISPHIDHKDFGPEIYCFTFGSGAIMNFSYYNVEYDLYTEPNSLYVMTGESRSSWRHSMPSRKTDLLDGKRIKRGVRYSITFRSINHSIK